MNPRSSLAVRWILVLAYSVSTACTQQPKSGMVVDEAKQVGRDAASFPHAAEDYFHDMDGGVALTPEEIKGRNMWLVWSGGNDRFWNQMTRLHLRRVRPAQDHQLASEPRLLADQPLDLLRPGQRALLREPDRARPGAARPVARRAQQGLRRRSVRRRKQVPRRRDRLARQAARRRHDAAGRLVLRLRDRHRRACGCSRIRPSTRRRPRPGTPSATTPIPSYYNRQGPDPPVSRRHVLRLLPCRPEPRETAGRSGRIRRSPT